MDHVIGFVSQKGGVGKSTLARAVAREFHENDFKVKLADMDVQQVTTVKWHARRLNEGLDPVGSVECFRSVKEAFAGVGDAELLVIDGAGRASKSTAELAQRSDLIVQPSAPSLDDLEPAVMLFHELAKAGIPRTKLYFALTGVATEKEEEMAREYLQMANYQVFDGSLQFKASYRAALNNGRTITETTHQSLNRRAEILLRSIIHTLLGEGEVKEEDNSYLIDNGKLIDNSKPVDTSNPIDTSNPEPQRQLEL